MMFACAAVLLFSVSAPTPTVAPRASAVARAADDTWRDADDEALAALRKFIESKTIDKTNVNWKSGLVKPPKVSFNKEKDYFWDLETSLGSLKIRLLPDVAPMHVSSLMYLTLVGFYDDLTFHRVIQGFMAQGGCPLGNGRGNPGYRFSGETDPAVKHDRPGLLSAANTGAPGTDGSQFFLTFKATPWLDGKHTIYGELVDGVDTLRKLEEAGTKDDERMGRVISIKRASISMAKAQAKANAGGASGEAAAVEAQPQEKKRRPLPSAKDSDSAALTQMARFIAKQQVDTDKPDWKTKLARPPQLEFNENKQYLWHMQTNKGRLTIRLMPEVAPMHVSSTIYLTRLGFYDNLTFHRVIPSFMAQGGCPLGKGYGGPGYTYGGEFSPRVRHDRPGLLSMANTGQPNSDGSQFFLTFKPTPHLDDKHTIFGEVIEGMDVLKKLERAGTPRGTTREPLALEQATISVN